MGDLTLTGLDEAVLEQLSQLATRHGRSAEGDAKQLLTSTVLPGQKPSPTLAMLAEARRQAAACVKSDTLGLIREGRDELA
jgi:plasmid stability protein